MPKKFEKQLVEDYVAKKLQELGWRFVAPEELERESIRELLLVENLKRRILKVNKDSGIGKDYGF